MDETIVPAEFVNTTIRFIQSFLVETDRKDWTVDDVINNYIVYPIFIGKEYVGLFGATHSETKEHKIVTVCFLYVDTPYRHNFRKVLITIGDMLREQGIDEVWIAADKRTAEIYETYFHKPPETYLFCYGLDEVMGKLNKWERANGQGW